MPPIRHTRAYLLCLLAVASSALHTARPDALATTQTLDAKTAWITPAPSPDTAKQRLDLRGFTIVSCAGTCIEAAITKSTGCSVGDRPCECQAGNAAAIQEGSFECIESNCGAVVALEVFSTARLLCSSVLAAPQTQAGSTISSVAPANNALPTDSSPSDSSSSPESSDSGSSHGSSGSPSGATDTIQNSKLSSGAIAGIVVGAVAAIAVVAGAIWMFCLRKGNRSHGPSNGGGLSDSAGGAGDAAGAPNPQSDAKTGALTTTAYTQASSVSPASNVSGLPLYQSTPSPQTSVPQGPLSHNPVMMELPGGQWQTGAAPPPGPYAQNVNPAWSPQGPPVQGVAFTQGNVYHETYANGIQPQMLGDTQVRPELPGQGQSYGTAYEMPADHRQ